MKLKGKKFELDDFSVQDLLDEASGYERRAQYHLRHPRNLKRAIEDIDKARAIFCYIVDNALSEQYREGTKPKFYLLNLNLAFALSNYAVEQLNYAWAKKIVRDEVEELKSLEERTAPFNFEELCSNLESRLKQIDIRERNFGGALSDVVPINDLHPQSLSALLRAYNEREEFNESVKIKGKIDSVGEALDEIIYPEIIILGKKLLLGHVSANACYDITRKRAVTVLDPEKLVLIKKKSFKDNLEIRTRTKEIYRRVMGLLNSDEIVFEFGRFFSDFVPLHSLI